MVFGRIEKGPVSDSDGEGDCVGHIGHEPHQLISKVICLVQERTFLLATPDNVFRTVGLAVPILGHESGPNQDKVQYPPPNEYLVAPMSQVNPVKMTGLGTKPTSFVHVNPGVDSEEIASQQCFVRQKPYTDVITI